MQKKIAFYLDRETVEIDALIADSTKLRELLLKRRSVLITDVVTGRKQV
ncbi:restriction modification system DNA specificity subunit [Corynebacterium humireducens NBRC 106098 = DSM 45392]|uniref:Restriction modification system DNA specificity subunit n=1 Tax=Corynebacterium humireducens NBRC 106098 = DSM 45392 TaxID=1223515 RepID=A0A0B5D8W1_9CORY|nr:restriction modification system DNA specificity subunit [Corynebacterium humireducens NBRC 106098 = DSM 45392]